MCARILAVFPVIFLAGSTSAEVVFRDGMDDVGVWSVTSSEGVVASLAADTGEDGQCVRLDFDFAKGSGYCVVRRDFDLELPENYRFSFSVRGPAPANNLEFKLIDDTGENVWWAVKRDQEFRDTWEPVSYRKRHIHFAWGPSGDKPLRRISAVEFAISAGSGGKGSIFLDSLRCEAVPAPQPVTHTPKLRASSDVANGKPVDVPVDDKGRLAWRSNRSDEKPWIEIDFQQVREFGGLTLDWDERDHPLRYDVESTSDGKQWESVASVSRERGGRDYIPLRDGEGSGLRIVVQKFAGAEGIVALRGFRIEPPAFAESDNGMFKTMAADARRGLYPRYFLDEHAPWTVVGIPNENKEALFSSDGALEVDKASFSVEPFVWFGGRLITWADVEYEHSLADDYLPIPTVSWIAPGLSLDITALAHGEARASTVVVRYRLTNTGKAKQNGSLALALRPYQVLPPWQDLNVVGGVAKVETVAVAGDRVVVNGERTVVPWTAPSAFGAVARSGGDITEYLAEGKLPKAESIVDRSRFGSAAMRFDFELDSGESKSVVVSVPLYAESKLPKRYANAGEADGAWRKLSESVADEWRQRLNSVTLRLPPAAADIANTFKSTQAYILINADGPSIQPGSRTYERSWMRDGALTSTALLATGHFDQVRAFLDWYAEYQYEDGKVPAVVDKRGPDPVAEYDSQGEFIYAMLEYYRRTGDRSLLEKHIGRIERAVDFVGTLRKQRMTDEYRIGTPEQRALFGIVPESVSHEGYCDVPRHSYWDCLFIIKGLKDAVRIAQIVERADLEGQFAAMRDAFRTATYDSMRLAMKNTGVDYIPGCAELGDFDATSTTIGLWPCGELGAIPEPQLHNTFEKYYDFCMKRRADTIEWVSYTPYENRSIGSFVILGQRERAHELASYFLGHRLPLAWNQWGEVVWRNPRHPGYVGDIPHTWVGSDFMNAVCTMFAYERDRDEALVLAAGLSKSWLESDGGVSIGGMRTPFGVLSYSLQNEDKRTTFTLSPGLSQPPGGIVLALPESMKPVTMRVDDGSAVSAAGNELKFLTLPSRVEIEWSDR